MGTMHASANPKNHALKVIGILNGIKIVIGGSRVASENVAFDCFLFGSVVILAVFTAEMPLSFVGFISVRKNKGHFIAPFI